MVGIVVITHGDFAERLILTAESIGVKLDKIQWVSIKERNEVEEARKGIARAIKNVDFGQGVLILTDMFGGSPSNLSLSFLDEGKVEVLAGVNLPMLLKVADLRKKEALKELAGRLKEYGQKSIVLASDVLKEEA
ncbi:MAG: PTS sugar transporter subunit IIA [Thermodesulfobacteriota bacterium]